MADAFGSLEAALEGVAAWRQEAEVRQARELSEVDEELEKLRAAIADYQRRIESLDRFRSTLRGKNARVDQEEVVRSYEAIFSVLRAQSSALAARADVVAAAEAVQVAGMIPTLRASESAPLLTEYEQFRASEHSLNELPPSYRKVLRHHHGKVVERLRAVVEALEDEAVSVDADGMAVELAFTIDSPEDAPDLLILVLPVSDTVHTEWQQRNDDLQTWLAARAMQGVYEAAHALGVPSVQAMYGGHQGLLALEVELPVTGDADVRAVIEDKLAHALGSAPELAGARLEVAVRHVPVDFLLPPEVELEEAAHGQ